LFALTVDGCNMRAFF